MWDTTAESEGPGSKCEWAAIALQAEELITGYAMLCLKSLQLVEDPDVRKRLKTVANKGNEVGWAARRIVEACNGCDESGYTVRPTINCPSVTRERVEEWLQKVGSMPYMDKQPEE